MRHFVFSLIMGLFFPTNSCIWFFKPLKNFRLNFPHFCSWCCNQDCRKIKEFHPENDLTRFKNTFFSVKTSLTSFITFSAKCFSQMTKDVFWKINHSDSWNSFLIVQNFRMCFYFLVNSVFELILLRKYEINFFHAGSQLKISHLQMRFLVQNH